MANDYSLQLPPAVLTGEEWIYSNIFARHALPDEVRKSLTFAVLFFDKIIFPSPPGLHKFLKVFGQITQNPICDYFKVNHPSPEVYKDWLLPLSNAGRADAESPSIDFYELIRLKLQEKVQSSKKYLTSKDFENLKKSLLEAKFEFEISYLKSVPILSIVNKGAVPLGVSQSISEERKKQKHNIADVYTELSKASITLLVPDLPALQTAHDALEMKEKTMASGELEAFRMYVWELDGEFSLRLAEGVTSTELSNWAKMMADTKIRKALWDLDNKIKSVNRWKAVGNSEQMERLSSLKILNPASWVRTIMSFVSGLSKEDIKNYFVKPEESIIKSMPHVAFLYRLNRMDKKI